MTVDVYNYANPPIVGASWRFPATLKSQANVKLTQTGVTLAAGDVTVFKDGVLDGNIDALPTEVGATGILVVILSDAEMTVNRFTTVKFHDVAGGQWCDAEYTIFPMIAVPVGTSDLTAALVDVLLSANHGNGLWGCLTGSGVSAFVYTVTATGSGLPIQGVSVFVTSDAAGATIVASGTTNALGQITFFLDPGTYYFWKQMAGYVDDQNPDIETVP